MKKLAGIMLVMCGSFLGMFLKSGNEPNPAVTDFQKRTSVSKVISGKEHLFLPRLDHDELMSEALREERKRGRYLFARAREIKVTPFTHGKWEGDGDWLLWTMEVGSEGAESLNFGFREFVLPQGGELTLQARSGEKLRFTSSDNDAHGELWTPILPTDLVAMELSVPKGEIDEVRLALEKVNHGFRSAKGGRLKGIGDSTSGRCHVDVICSAQDDAAFGPVVDMFRNQIRAVGAYTVDGVEVCSGALVNNTRNDATPYFLTAEHCGLTPALAPSVVVYWNFENSSCRIPGSVASGSDGDGPILEFNSGAIFRAAYAETDFCLIELDDAVDSAVEPYFAGWDRRGIPASMAVGIHHPGVSEKRISIEVDPTTATDYYQNNSIAQGTHVRVGDWDFGTTEGGSSGSPLFDQSGRIIAQLSGGEAACGNDEPDWYGRLSQSWEGGGTAESRLRDWLDPLDSQVDILEGINAGVFVRVSDAEVMEGDSGSSVVNVAVSLSEVSEETISVRVRTEARTATAADFSSLDQVLTFAPGSLEQWVPLMITGDLSPEEHESFAVILSEGQGAIASAEPAVVTILNDDYIQPEVTSAAIVSVPVREQLSYQIEALNTPTGFAIENGPAGLEVDGASGQLSWLPGAEGTFTVDLVAVNPAGEGRKSLTILVTTNSLAEAIDLVAEVELENGAPGWNLQTAVTHDGIDAAVAENPGSSSFSDFSVTVEGPDVVEFWWKVDSEERFDFLSVLLDGDEVAAISGTVDWEKVEVAIPAGTHRLTWRYRKDDSEDVGADTGWVDEVGFGSASGLPVIVSAREIQARTNEMITYEIASLGGEATYQVTGLPPGLSFDGDRTISGSVDSKLTTEVMLQASLPGGATASAALMIQIVDDLSVGVDNTSQVWLQSGEALWEVQTSVTLDGVDAVRSGGISGGESSIFSAEVTGPDAMSFYWKVDSERLFDFLFFKIDGVVIESISGSEDWRRVEVEIPSGRHLVAWEYFKDDTEDSGADAGWVDEIRFRSDGKPFIQVDSIQNPVVGESVRISLDVLNSPSSVLYPGLPNWLEVEESTGDLIGVPPGVGTVSFSVRAENHLGLSEVPVVLRIIDPSPALASALDLASLAVGVDAGGSWTSIAEDQFKGGTAAGSVNPGDDGESRLHVYFRGPGRLRFDWGVSSEDGYDFLELRLNGQTRHQITGEIALEERVLSLEPGLHEVSFIYRKDDSFEEGLDRGWVDHLRLEGFSEFLYREGVSQLAGEPGIDGDKDGYGLFEEYALGGAIDDPNSPKGVDFQVEENGGPSVSFRGLSNPLDVDYEVQTSVTLKQGSWSDTGLAPALSGAADGYSIFKYQGFAEGDRRRFFRYLIIPKRPE